jgi:hypothetical protein
VTTATTREWSFHDAGRLPLPLRAFNAVGAGLAAVGIPLAPLDPERLLAAARRETGLDDFGDPGFREGLDVLVGSVLREGGQHAFGRMAFAGLLKSVLANRLRLVDWAKRHPEVRAERIARPFVVLGMPRTGTTLLSFLLDLDPNVRSLRHWESLAPIPPPDLAGHAEDPRIALAAKQTEQMHRLVPPMPAMHPMSATLATECVPLLALDLKSLQFETQAPAPSYGRWLEQADPRPAYAIHQLVLQSLQSTIPTGTWALKTPQHLWHLPALRERYPDARLVWTHRDPAAVVPSVASLNQAFYRTWCRNPDPKATGAYWNHKLRVGVERGLRFDAEQQGRSWCHHLHYAELMKDPVGAVERLYAHFGDSVSDLHARRMRRWMQERGQAAFGRHVYVASELGLSRESLAEEYRDYRERFGVAREG